MPRSQTMRDPIHQPIRDEGYLEYLRHQPCVACMASAPSEPHHLEQGKVGKKADDWSGVSLCHTCHRIYHDQGQRTLEKRHNVNLWRQSHRQLRRYHKQKQDQ